MSADASPVPVPSDRLDAFARVVVRIGLNLQPRQPLLITDPYDLHGVHPDAMPLAGVISALAGDAASIMPAEPDRLRHLFEADDEAGYDELVRRHTRRLAQHLASGGAFLFLTGSAPQLFAGLPIERLMRFERAKWRRLGPLIQQLVRGASQWTLVPAPTRAWALTAGVALDSLWSALFSAVRLDAASPETDWQVHLAGIGWQRDQLNAAGHRRLRYTGRGTDLTVALPRTHRWCTTQLTTRRGIPFVANLPTEEIFTAPHRGSATGSLRVARPIVHAGAILEGIELEFRRGRVVAARADRGQEALEQLLAVDEGAARLGEVAIVPGKARLTWADRPYHHILMDENAAHHVALGDGYRFCSRAWLPLALNSSQLHLDLPLDAEAELS